MSSATVEPISAMLARWWAATQAGDDTGAALIIGLWRAEVIASAADGKPLHGNGRGITR
jgi:hypothetical protein